MISLTQVDDIYQIKFKYDPALINLIKNVPGRKWNPTAKVWTIPKDKLGFLLNEVKGTVYEEVLSIQSTESINQNATLDYTKKVPDVDVSKIPFYVKEGSRPYRHQIDFMKYVVDRDKSMNRSGFILADDPGLGKTLEIINMGIYRKNDASRRYKHCLIICCINTSKYNWYDDICDHTRNEYEPYLIGTRIKKNGNKDIGGSAAKLEDIVSRHMYGDTNAPELPYFIIINIEAIRYRVGKKYPIADALIQMVKDDELQMIAIDEVHKNTSPTSIQGKQLLRIKKETGCKVEWVPMTGTPITKSPLDVFLPLKLVDGHCYSSFYTWKQEFCLFGGYGGHDILGYKNIPKLKNMLQDNMLRRRKEDELDLPPKIHITEYVENTAEQQRLYCKVQQELKKSRGTIMQSMNPLAQFIKLRQVNGSPELIDKTISVTDSTYLSKNAKLQRLLEIVENNIAKGEKTIVFSNWVEPLRTIYKQLSGKYKVCCFTGTMADDVRQKHKRVFINNPEYKIMLGTIGALGTTHTLAVAQNVIFYDEPWNATDKEQAEDRAHRIGTTQSLNVYTIISRGTIDDVVHNIVYKKKGTAEYIVDDKLDLKSHPELVDMFLN